MLLQQLGWSYMVTFDKCKIYAESSSTSTFCVKAKKTINVVSFKNAIGNVIMSCIYGRYNKLILSEFLQRN